MSENSPRVINITPVKLQKVISESTSTPNTKIVLVEKVNIVNENPAVDVELDSISINDIREYIEQIIDLLNSIPNYSSFVQEVKDVLVSFDTDPKRYTKLDYLKLVYLIIRCFKSLYNKDFSDFIINNWEESSVNTAPSSILVKTALESINNKLLWIIINDGNE